MKEENIENLLAKYITGSTTAEETKAVEEWLDIDNDHQERLKDYVKLDFAIHLHDAHQHHLSSQAWRKIQKKIYSPFPIWLKTYQRIAAIILLPLIIGLGIATTKLIGSSSRATTSLHVRTYSGMTTQFYLPDSTFVILNAGSEITYPSHFSENQRMVKLSGEAYFEVTKDPKRRFIVKTSPLSQIEVYGTKFNVEAYPFSRTITTTLVEGHVAFIYQDSNRIQKKIHLSPGQKSIYDLSGHLQSLYTNTKTETAWKDGLIIFDNTSMRDVLKVLSKRFNVQFAVKSPKIYENAFTGTFTNQRLEKILEYFRRSSGIHWKYLPDKYEQGSSQSIELR